jgi:hypothetical protein
MPKVDYNKIKTESGESKYVKFKIGENKLRIVSDVYESLRHQLKINDQFKNIACPKTLDRTAPCPICSMGDKPKDRWIVKVIDRSSNTVKILESGHMIFGQLSSLNENPEYGDPREFDITITRKGEKLDTEYNVIPARVNSKLTAEEIKMVKDDKFDLELYTTPRTEGELKEILKGVEKEEEINVENIPF